MAVDIKSLIPIIMMAIDAAQSSLIPEDKEVVQDIVDALQNIIVLAFDDVDNKDQLEALGKDLLEVIAKYDGSVEPDAEA